MAYKLPDYPKFTGKMPYICNGNLSGGTVIWFEEEACKKLWDLAGSFDYEVGGFLFGQIFSLNNTEDKLVYIEDISWLENTAENKDIFFSSCEKEQNRQIRFYREAGFRPVGIWHSHPGFSTRPSDHDRKVAAYFCCNPWGISIIINPFNRFCHKELSLYTGPSMTLCGHYLIMPGEIADFLLNRQSLLLKRIKSMVYQLKALLT